MLISRRALLATAATLVAAPAWAVNASPALIEAAKKEGAVVFYTSVDVAVAERMTQAFNRRLPRTSSCASNAPAPNASCSG